MKKKLLFLFLIIFVFFVRVEAQSINNDVLFISSYSISFETVPLQIEGIKQVLKKDSNIDYEFMDSKRFNTQENKDKFKSYLEFKSSLLSGTTELRNYYDVVLVGDDNALEFVLNNNKNDSELFYKIPVVFLAINNLELAKQASLDDYITGVCEDFSYKETLELAIKFNSLATNIVCTLDNTSTGMGDLLQIEKIKGHFEDLGYEFIIYNSGDYSYSELKVLFNQIKNEDTIFFAASLFEDKLGETKNMAQMCEFLYENVNAPVYNSSVGQIVKGIAGGIFVSYEAQGTLAGNMALRVLNGENIKDIEMIEECPKVSIFDISILKKYNVNTAFIPKNSIKLNDTGNFFTNYKTQIVSTIVTIIIFLCIFIPLLVNAIKKNSVNKRLSEEFKNLRQIALLDPLTKLSNRRSLVTKINKLIDGYKKFAFVVIDVNKFKEINDTYGHAVGDDILIQIAKRFNQLESKTQMFARFGGDEFIAVLVAEKFYELDEKVHLVHGVFKEPFKINGKDYNITVSMGVSIYPGHGNCLDDLLTAADDAMYDIKKINKNGVKYYSN